MSSFATDATVPKLRPTEHCKTTPPPLNRIEDTMRIALLLVCLAGAHAADWPQFRGPTRDGISIETTWTHTWPDTGPKKLWQAQVGIGMAGCAVSKGKVFTAGHIDGQDIIWCLDAKTGKALWQYSFPAKLDPKMYEGGPSATPTVVDDSLYTISKDGQIYNLNVDNGAIRWQHNLADDGIKGPTWGFASSAIVVDDLVLFNVGKAGIALSREDGHTVWSNGTGKCGYATPVIYKRDGKSYAALFASDTLRSVAVSDGAIQWELPWKTQYGENTPDPIITDKTLFISTGHGLGSSLFTLANGEPKLLWNTTALGNHLCSSVLRDGFYYGFSGRVNKPDGHLGCLDAATGKQVWSKDIRGSLILAGDRLIIVTLSGELIIAAADPTEYKELARAQVLGGKCWTPPTLSDNQLFVRNSKGEVVCLDLSAP